MNRFYSKAKLPPPLLGFGFGVASLVCAAQSPAAETPAQTGDSGQQAQTMEFGEADLNNDGYVDWEELHWSFDNELSEAGLTQKELFEDFDLDRDLQLDTGEFHAFTTGFTERREYSAAEIEGQEQGDANVDAEGQGTATSQSARDEPVAESEQQQRADEDVYGTGEPRQSQDETAGTTDQAEQNGEAAITTIVSVSEIQQVPIEDITDREVVNLEDEKIGTVEDIVRNGDGSEIGLVIRTVGLFGIGGKDVVIDSEEVHITEEKVVWERAGEDDSVDELPEYNENEYMSLR